MVFVQASGIPLAAQKYQTDRFGVAFGFYQVHPRIYCSIYWLRSPTKSTVQAHEQVTADGAVRDTGKFSSYKQGVAFGFSGRVPKEQ